MTKKQLEAKILERKQAAIQFRDQKLLEQKAAYIESERFLEDELAKEDNLICARIDKALDEISDKKFTRYREFNYGTHANCLIGLIKTVTLQKQEGHAALELHLAESEVLANAVAIVHETGASSAIEHMGRNTYLDKLTGEVENGEIGNAQELKVILESVARELEIAKPDFTKLSQDKMELVEAKAIIKTNTQLEDNKLLEEEYSDDDSEDVVYK